MEFYKIWTTSSGLIGVNKLTLGDVVGVQVVLFIAIMIMIAILVLFFPIMLFGIYILLMIGQDGSSETSPTRLGINIITIIVTIYFLLDFHFGWYSHSLLATSMYAETYDGFAILNLSITLMSIALFFVGHEIYRIGQSKILRVIMFGAFIFFGFKFTDKVSATIITNVVTQYNDSEIIESRVELREWDEANTTTDKERLENELEAIEKEEAEEKRLREFDKNFVRDYLN